MPSSQQVFNTSPSLLSFSDDDASSARFSSRSSIGVPSSLPESTCTTPCTPRSPACSEHLGHDVPGNLAKQLLRSIGLSESASAKAQVFALCKTIERSAPAVSPQHRQALGHVLVSNDVQHDGRLPDHLRKHCIWAVLEHMSNNSDASRTTHKLLESYVKKGEVEWVYRLASQVGLKKA